MKKTLLFLLLAPCSLIAQNKNRFMYIAPGYFFGNNSNNLFMPAVGIGFKHRSASAGVSVYYTSKFTISTNLDLRLIYNSNKSSDPFFTIQPGISFYNKSSSNTTTKGGFDFKAGIGVMSKSKGLYLSVGYYTFDIKTTFSGGDNSGSIQGIFLLGGIKF